jgi:hypothetical protein
MRCTLGAGLRGRWADAALAVNTTHAQATARDERNIETPLQKGDWIFAHQAAPPTVAP